MGNSCLSKVEPIDLYFEGQCSYTNLITRLNLELAREAPSCPWGAVPELRLLLERPPHPDGTRDVPTITETETYIETLCQSALDQQSQLGWKDVTKKAAQQQPLFDGIYYDGGSVWNEQYETNVDNRVPFVDGRAANVLEKDGSRIDDVYEVYAKEGKIEYADAVVDNFANCPLRAAMCCFVSDRQANDNNGNCAEPYDDNCVNADPADNTDLCYVDMSRDTSAPGTNGGFAIYPGDNANGEGSIHCHGLAWSNNPNDMESRYKGNNLFYVSMYDHLYTRGYVRNVPGAPMCGCLDTMPVVSRSDCTQVDVTELWVAKYTPGNETVAPSISLGLDVENGVSVQFNACRGAVRNNDLESYYHRLSNEGRASVDELEEVRETLVGNNNCQSSIDEFMTTQGFETM